MAGILWNSPTRIKRARRKSSAMNLGEVEDISLDRVERIITIGKDVVTGFLVA